MKRFFTMILVFVAALALASCGEKEFKQDGKFTAFEITAYNKAPMITSVTVTVEKGKVVSYFIDARQGTAVHSVDADNVGKWTFTWNEKTKKELGYDYHMHDGPRKLTADAYKQKLKDENKKEWFEQANLIEAEFLAKGPENVTDIKTITGVTINDGGYTKLAKAAVANAKAGKVVAFEHTMNYGIPNVVWVEVTVEKGKATKIVVDTLQATANGNDSETGLVWNAKSKQELGYAYGMFAPQFKKSVADNLEEYKTWLKTTNRLEWFEQVALVTDDILKNGLKTEPKTPLAGVTITTTSYYKLINTAYKAVGLTK
jgi:hypothetical protein